MTVANGDGAEASLFPKLRVGVAAFGAAADLLGDVAARDANGDAEPAAPPPKTLLVGPVDAKGEAEDEASLAKPEAANAAVDVCGCGASLPGASVVDESRGVGALESQVSTYTLLQTKVEVEDQGPTLCMSAGGLVSSRALFFCGSDRCSLSLSPSSTMTQPSDSAPLLARWPSPSLFWSTSSCARFFLGEETFFSPAAEGVGSGVLSLEGRSQGAPDRNVISSSLSCCGWWFPVPVEVCCLSDIAVCFSSSLAALVSASSVFASRWTWWSAGLALVEEEGEW